MKPPRSNIDLHVHTRRYSPCAETLDPYELGEEMRRKDLHGIVLTEHDHIWNKKETEELRKAWGDDLIIYRGVEISSEDGHLLIIGIDDLNGIRPRLPAEEVIARAKQKGAAVVLAHPCYPDPQQCRDVEEASWAEKLDALEVASSVTVGEHETMSRDLARHKGLLQVAGSDAHALSMVGETYTAFARLPADEKELARMIREGQGMPARNNLHHAD